MAVDVESMEAQWGRSVGIGKELELVKHYVLLGIVMRILDHDIRIVGAAGTKLPTLYEGMLRGLQDRVLLELASIRKQFRVSGIRVIEEKSGRDGLTAQYVCRGYYHNFSMIWSFVKAEAERLLKVYMSK
ncbi:hypothetical protein K0T92_15495 [Paenibacillus oenotherae]|uniref:Uncharacterized protein n=1 Tax=Paenibacillus oenotherae TaxID=1435645 RepID=A0ABS7D885_9BACL|nr:hypothetical protein [Paenibacillus oenotherae]MBW7476147.1 hypothetical protein [Paenibacillus oenotherae]